MESSSLVAIPGSRLPEMLGNFHLDNHHVEEWSDPAEPGHKHRARKEVGKWINLEENADIHYQKQEDSKQTDRSQERSRTEVIQGTAPDSTFQVVRSHHQYQDGDENSGSKMQQTSSTSYHVSSSRGVRSTTKQTTSNKTTTKTVTVSGGSGGRTDDFENLRMSFTPLDTSTQRERINVSRSGTMGIRRPPTRRHTPAALVCSSPEDGPEARRPAEGEILVDSDDNLRDTPDPVKMNDSAGISIVGFKNISPKIRVGFPVEIQLELQTKLRSSSTLEREHKDDDDSERNGTGDEAEVSFLRTKETDERPTLTESSALPIPLCGLSSGESTFDFRERRRSFLSESYDSSSKDNQQSNFVGSVARRRSSLQTSARNDERGGSAQNLRNSIGFLNHVETSSSNNHQERSPPPAGISWDLIQNLHQLRQSSEHSGKVYSTLSSGIGTGSGEDLLSTKFKLNDSSSSVINDSIGRNSRFNESQKGSFTQRLKTIDTTNGNKTKTVVTLNASQESLSRAYEQQHDSLEKSSLEDDYDYEADTDKKIMGFEPTNDFKYHHHHVQHYQQNDSQLVSTPDVLHHENSSSTSLSPSLERSRKLLKMLDETPDLLNKMSFRSYFSTADKADNDWGDEEKDDMDWETQRQLSFLNDSLSRILDESRSIDNIMDKDKTGHHIHADHIPLASVLEETNNNVSNNTAAILWKGFTSHELDFNGNLKEAGKLGQVSQTWISSVDHKPAQTVRDHDVVTSISATNDAYKKGPKKVEFCKTEVHFTPDSGRFNIVETDENKPSTAHLFRRKKRSEKKEKSAQVVVPPVSPYSSSSSMSSLDSTTDKPESAYILEMQLDSQQQQDSKAKGQEVNVLFSPTQSSDNLLAGKTSVPVAKVTSFQSQWEKSVEKVHGRLDANNSKQHFIAATPPEEKDVLPALTTSSGSKFVGDKASANNYDDSVEAGHRVLINLDKIGSDEYDDEVRSPSHTILSNYGEMKIQRYLKQLKSPSRESSTSPLGSPTPQENEGDGHFRFDSVLYEQGSFVPLATRRSLIEMNNRNRKRMNGTSQSSDNSSTTSTYSLPNSDKDQYGTLRLGTVEATVATRGTQPQITSVEFRYTHDKPQQNEHRDYHSLSVRERRERFSLVPSPVMPPVNLRHPIRHSIAMSPTESHASDFSSTRPASSTFLTKKPPTPILPMQFANFEKAGAELRERFYAKSNSSCLCVSDSEAAATTPSTAKPAMKEDGRLASRSIVTIGSPLSQYDEGEVGVMRNSSQEMVVTSTTTLQSPDPDVEPVLGLDHTWKGPAAQGDNPLDTNTTHRKAPAPRSLTFPKSIRTEPEWVSKAKSRESRVTDWTLIEKQQQSNTPTRNTEPPWISEIRFRNKPIPIDELKSLPKISVVYPWQRDSGSKEPSVERVDSPPEEIDTHIVSMVPQPSSPQHNGTTLQREKRMGSYDLYSGKSMQLSIKKSLKSVPEVSIPSKKSHAFVEPTVEPEHYITIPQKYHHLESSKGHTISKTSSEKKASSMRITTTAESTVASILESKRESETFPKKSRKPLHVTQANKDAFHTTPTGQRILEERQHRTTTEPKPPKPPHRSPTKGQDAVERMETVKATPPYREISRHHHKDKVSSGSMSNQTSTVSKRSSGRKSDMEESSPTTSQTTTPIIHRHPTIQITKLPMRTTKSTVVEGKRVVGSSSTSSKSKAKHHAPSKGENLKPGTPSSSLSTSTAGGTSSPCRDSATRKLTRRHENDVSKCGMTSGSSSQIKKSSRPPVPEFETKKRRTTTSTNGGSGHHRSQRK